MLTVRKVETVVVLDHPTAPRRAVFAALADGLVRYTLYRNGVRHQTELDRPAARSRYAWLRKLGYRPAA